jgi:NADH-quinone oxidoreductase subunit A
MPISTSPNILPALAESVLLPYLPAAVFLVIVLVTAALMLGASWLCGPRRPSALKSKTYECGVPLIGGTRERFSVKFYLVAILFVLFDIETVFLIPWAVKFRALGAFGVLEMFLFMAVLVVGLAYAWRRGGLEWK